MGMIWKLNEALTSALVMAACTVAEACWHSPIGNESREQLEDVICFMLAEGWTDGLLTFWDELQMEEDSHVLLTLNRRFKGEVDKRWHLVHFSNHNTQVFPSGYGWRGCCTKESTSSVET